MASNSALTVKALQVLVKSSRDPLQKAMAEEILKLRKGGGKESDWPAIRSRANKGGTVSWCVDPGILNERRERYFFKTRTEAETKAEQLRIKRENEGLAGLVIPERLRVEAMECAKILEPFNVSLTDAVRFYVQHAQPHGGELTIPDLVEAFLKAKEAAGRSVEYINVQGYVLRAFARDFPTVKVHEVRHTDLEEWMCRQKWTLRTRANYYKDLRNLFGFAVTRGYSASNPVLRIEKPQPPPKAPGILTVKQAEALLDAASEEMRAALAIGLFCGLRSAKIERLDWKHVHMNFQTVEVTAESSKTSQRRIVDMPKNLIEWLKSYSIADST